MPQIDLQAIYAFRVSMKPLAGGRNRHVIIQGDVPEVGTEVMMKREKYRIIKIVRERVISVIKR